MDEESKSGTKKKESFDGSRKDINTATDRICEFTGKICRNLLLSIFTNSYLRKTQKFTIFRNKNCLLGSEGAIH